MREPVARGPPPPTPSVRNLRKPQRRHPKSIHPVPENPRVPRCGGKKERIPRTGAIVSRTYSPAGDVKHVQTTTWIVHSIIDLPVYLSVCLSVSTLEEAIPRTYFKCRSSHSLETIQWSSSTRNDLMMSDRRSKIASFVNFFIVSVSLSLSLSLSRKRGTKGRVMAAGALWWTPMQIKGSVMNRTMRPHRPLNRFNPRVISTG